MGEGGKERVEKCCIMVVLKCEYANLNGCKILNFGTVTDGEGGKERFEKSCILVIVKC